MIIDEELPNEGFVYSDRASKPQYIRFLTIYDLYIFKRMLNEADLYIYIEEALPNQDNYFFKDGDREFNGEVWSGIWI